MSAVPSILFGIVVFPMESQSGMLPQVTRVCQIIKFALAMGVATFGGVAIFQRVGKEPGSGPLFLIMVAFTASIVVGRLVVPSSIAARMRARIATGTWRDQPGAKPLNTDEEKLLAAFQTQMIVGSALLEGGAFANLFAFMSEGNWISLGIAVALLAGLLIDFPTQSSVANWLDGQKRRMQEQRMLAGPPR